MASIDPAEVSAILKKELSDISAKGVKSQEIGTVLEIGDGIARLYGLDNASLGEIIEFENGSEAMILNLDQASVGVVFLGAHDDIIEGSRAKRTARVSSIMVGEGMIGRVINTMGYPIDGKGALEGELLEMPIERKAPGVIFRQPVNEPLQTGIKAIDAMIPIGRGQRELIIGDRQTGKSTIAVDTIINQKQYFDAGKPVYCIYVAVAQKASTVAQTVKTLQDAGAMAYTCVVAANASDPTAMQYLAPFSGAAIGEFFRDSGLPALIIYDDLSKQAVAYREVSLLLKRPPGREAYPGDIFYLHSRLLERAARIVSDDQVASQMNDLPASMKGRVEGGGSLTALPIIETQAGDVSAYIPTNVISITDGQIFLESDLFNAGVRPAINAGISVSRVGGNAQIKPMKKFAGPLRTDQAQYRELEAFAKFGSDLDAATKIVIEKGRRNSELLKQGKNDPYKVQQEVAVIFAGTENLLREIPMDRVSEFEQSYLNELDSSYKATMESIASGKITDQDMDNMRQAAKTVVTEMMGVTDAPDTSTAPKGNQNK